MLSRLLLFALVASALSAQESELCLECHAEKDLSAVRQGAAVSMYVDGPSFGLSVHGAMGCTGCHMDLDGVDDFPHEERLAEVACGNCHDHEAVQMSRSIHGKLPGGDRLHKVRCWDCHGAHGIRSSKDPLSRTSSINIPKTCSICHSSRGDTKWQVSRLRSAFEYYEKSIHGKALLQWELSHAADCVDCHGFHEILSIADPSSQVNRSNIARTCGRCHVGAVQRYNRGIHAKAFAEGVNESAVCTDCHTEHGVLSPTDSQSNVYLTTVVTTCIRCHADKEIVSKYGVSVELVATYQQSYHGIGMKFGSMVIANCVSCHKYHDIKTQDDPSSSVHPSNLKETCGQPRCHVKATDAFVDAKVHVPVTKRERGDIVAMVRFFYVLLIVATIGGMLAYNLLDLRYRIRHARKDRDGGKRT